MPATLVRYLSLKARLGYMPCLSQRKWLVPPLSLPGDDTSSCGGQMTISSSRDMGLGP